jgi:uncharacterized protein (DUF2141 family)
MNINKTLLFGVAIICMILMIQCNSTDKKEQETELKTKPTNQTDTIIIIDSNKINNEMNNEMNNEDTDIVVESSMSVNSPLVENLSIHVSLLKAIPSVLNITIYGTNNEFPSTSDYLKTYKFKINSSKYTAVLKGVKYGSYAIAMYQDENNSGQINKNVLGVPTERYGFSQNYMPKIKAPSFDNCKFIFSKKSSAISVQMIP